MYLFKKLNNFNTKQSEVLECNNDVRSNLFKRGKDKVKRKVKVASTKRTIVSPELVSKKLLINKQKRIKYKNQTYEISKPSKATQKNKKYQVTVKNISTGQKKTVSWGRQGYADFLVHKDPKRRERFQKRFNGIKLKDGTKAADNPMSPAYYSTRYNW